jgi:hypothetical protein
VAAADVLLGAAASGVLLLICTAIWANTSVSKGGAKGPSERASVALTMLLDEKAALDEGGEQAALMSTNGLLAYAQEMIWVSAGFEIFKCQRQVCAS